MMMLTDFSSYNIVNTITQHITVTEGLFMHFKNSILVLYNKMLAETMKFQWVLEDLIYFIFALSKSFHHSNSSLLTNF